jgi:putative oxidoreductase
MKQTLSSWEPYARSIMRIIVAFVFSLHGFRIVYGMFPQLARRGGVGRMPLDTLPQFTGYIAIIAGALLMIGLLTRATALVLALQALAGYVFVAAPRGAVPLRAGANEVLLYFLIFLYLAVVGAGPLSLDHLIGKLRHKSELQTQRDRALSY